MTNPFPPFIRSASGTKLQTIEGLELLDFWQGHFCAILGHNHRLVLDALQKGGEQQMLLQVGVNTELEEEVASLLVGGTGFESFIFSNSGALATMQAIMLGLAYTGRSKVIKIAGGWHGAHPWSLKAVRFSGGTEHMEMEGAGVPPSFNSDVLIVPHNDCDALRACFDRHGPDIGVCIAELVLGNAGMVMAEPEFVCELRSLSNRHGSVLIIDELVTAYRVRLGCMYPLFGIVPDIVTIGKAMSGGMPFACIAGRRDILARAATANIPRVWADNGTFTSHPSSLIAARTMLQHFQRVGPKFFFEGVRKMDHIRERLAAVFAARGISAHITGESSDQTLPNFPIGTVRFLRNPRTYAPRRAISHWDDTCVDISLRDQVAKISLFLRGVHCWQGLGVVSDAHTNDDIDLLVRAYEGFADEIADAYDWGADVSE